MRAYCGIMDTESAARKKVAEFPDGRSARWPRLKEASGRAARACDAPACEAPRFDDMTLLCVIYKGAGAQEGEGRMKELTLAAKVENIPQVTAFIDEQLEALDCSMKAQMQIDIAIDELFGNIAHYAYPDGGGDVTVRFDFDASDRAAQVTFIDRGTPFDPLKLEEPDVTLDAQARSVGGLGVFLVKKTMDGMRYAREGDSNVLTIRKKL